MDIKIGKNTLRGSRKALGALGQVSRSTQLVLWIKQCEAWPTSTLYFTLEGIQILGNRNDPHIANLEQAVRDELHVREMQGRA